MNKDIRQKSVLALADNVNMIIGQHLLLSLGDQANFMSDYPQGCTFYASLYPSDKKRTPEYSIEFSQSSTTGYVLVTGSYLVFALARIKVNRDAVHHIKLLLSQILRYYNLYQPDSTGVASLECVISGEPVIYANVNLVNPHFV